MDNSPLIDTRASDKRELDRRLVGLSWALFLIMIGGLWLIPNVPGGVWLIGTGVIMLGLNAARYLNGIHMRFFSSVLGAFAVLLGVAILLGLDWPVLPIILIVMGASIIFDLIAPTARHAVH
ncbi:MAG TPA: hypothetical protein VF812_10385 [Ktedonobacterales bacterium]